jgi:uncharacterized protein (TIGR03437 family)
MSRSLCALLAPCLLVAYSGGPPIKRTGAPGERICIDGGCHAGTRIDHSGALMLDTGTRFTYAPGGARQRWKLRIADPLARAYGFELSVRANEAGAGNLDNVDSRTQVICGDERLRGPAGCNPSTLVQFIEHTAPREVPEFELFWTPPANDQGPVRVWVAANASVSCQRDSRIHLRSFALLPVSAGVVNAAGFEPTISPGSWFTIFENGLASTAREWRAGEIRDGILPVSLDDVRVRVNGRPASIAYISPGQINAQAPDNDISGILPVSVLRDGRVIAEFRVNHQPRSPALFAHESNGRRYAVAVDADGVLIGARRARGGETLVIYGTGFGQTRPPVPAGRTVPAPAQLREPIRVTIGNREARVSFAGLIGPGLYQVNLVVPELSAGDHAVVIEIDGKPSPSGVFLPVN